MGVRGLTTFIAQNCDKYLRIYELHDTYLVVDGNNLAAQLYKWHTKCYDCFGGDYDKYAQTVIGFFNLLKECNVTPLIIFDGGYENKKLKTVYSRVKTRIKQTRMLNCITETSMTVFPLFLRELFVEIILQLNLKVVRCLVEADFEMACIARKLNCPLLSYDSDFYIFDVEYIPFNTVLLNSTKTSGKNGYKYLDCQVYRIEHFLKVYRGLKKDCIPLLGVLLGNDYIHIRVFSNFYRQLKKQKIKPGSSDQQRRIKSLIAWLQTETFESAIRKVLGRTKQVYRKKVANQILSVANDYICAESELLKYFNLNITSKVEDLPNINVDLANIDHFEGSDSDNESSKEEIESSDGDISELMENEDVELETTKLSEYFKEKYRKCLYPTCFIDIVLHERYIFIPVIEDYSKPQCHNISLNILSAICTILNANSTGKLKYILRNERGRMQNFVLPKSNKVLPNFPELQYIGQKQSFKYMLGILEIDENFIIMLNKFPESWRLFIISMIYWIQNATPHVNECFIYALLLSAIVIKSIGVGYCRNEAKFLKKYAKDLKYIESNPVKVIKIDDITVKSALDTITDNDMIIIMKELIPNFDMVIKLKRIPKLFDCGIIHIFAQFQSCAFYIKYLNSLLNNPFEDYLISDFYNGTLIYNLTNNFLCRPQLESYLELLMKNSPNLYNAFNVIKTHIQTDLSNKCKKNTCLKRRRKKRKKTMKTNTDEIKSDTETEEELVDANNRFSVLRIIDR